LGLPADLVRLTDDSRLFNNGFKAMSIASSALAAEALKATMPAASFSRSTESHNQDKVSMGTIAARDCLRVLQLTEQVASALLIATVQALSIRLKKNEIQHEQLAATVLKTIEQVSSVFEYLEIDRPLDNTLRELISLIQNEQLELYS